ncbi:hypothetical protein JCM10213_003641 [Rhodosporidiobolus nylandii]
MSQHSAVDIRPRHLQGSTSTSSTSSSSPIGTPPTSASGTTAPSYTRSPASSAVPLPSPGNAASTSSQAPGSPSSSSSNRFGLNLGFIQRRPRGWTTSSAQRSPATSPNGELPPSPGGGDRAPSGSYGFPALRRSLSKRASSQSGEGRPRARRSSSQPPAPHGLDAGTGSGSDSHSRPGTGVSQTGGNAAVSSSSSQLPQAPPSFSSLTATTSLPNPPNSVGATPSRSATGETSGQPETSHKLRLVPHLESSRSLHFDPIERDLAPSAIIRVGRFTDRHGSASNASPGTATEPARVAFKSKVVSRGHAEIWVDDAGKFFIRDTKSSSGTFLNHIRLSSPNVESRPYNLKDGDVLQLGVDYQGGTEEIYRCVKMRVELNRGWQRGANSFNTAALAQLRALGAVPMETAPTAGTALTAVPSSGASPSAPSLSAVPTAQPQPRPASAAASITDCCICLYPVTVCQALFIAPCSHVTHFKCIRPLIEQNYPGFCCPLCRAYGNLEADVEIDLPEPEPAPSASEQPHDSALGLSIVSREPEMDAVEEVDEPASRAPSIRAPRPSGSARTTRSRPASIAPSLREGAEGESAAAGEEGTSEEGASQVDQHGAVPNDSASSFAAPPIPHLAHLPSSPDPAVDPSVAIPSSSHLAPPSDDLYASLASAATPPNNTFLSTLAESGGALPAFAGAVGGSFRPSATGPPASGAEGMGSLDAAVLGEAGPSKVSLGATTTSAGSGSDGDGEDGGEGEGSAVGEVDDAETQEATSQPDEEAVVPSLALSGGKGKGKEREAEVEVADHADQPPPLSATPAVSPKKGKGPANEEELQADLGIAAAAALLI